MKVYLAGGLGFSELGNIGMNFLKSKLNKDFEIIDPFEKSAKLGKRIAEIQMSTLSYQDMKEQLEPINYEIGKRNADFIKMSDIILANLDGSDVDSGTASEIGFAYALGKKIIGYRGDFRFSTDNLGAAVNLQVEYFIKSSGGKIVTNLDDLMKELEKEN